MDSTISELMKLLAKAIKASNQGETQPMDTAAEVKRVEDDTAWVQFAGGNRETPVTLTIACKAGDIVQCRVSGGKAWITGNLSAPPTDDTAAKAARVMANTAEKKAIQSGEAAGKAQETADDAYISAGDALLQAIAADEVALGTITYEYDNNGNIETVYRKADGTYYYLEDNGEETTEIIVRESDLEVDESGNPIENRQSNGLDTRIDNLNTDIEAANQYAEALSERVTANKEEADLNSLIAREYADIENGQLYIYGKDANGNNVATLKLTSTEVSLESQGATAAQMRNENGQGIMSSTYMEQTFVKMKKQSGEAAFQWITQSNGHLSLKKL